MAPGKELWRWKEYDWRDISKDWRKARVRTAGVDIGSVSSKAVVLLDGDMFAFRLQRTSADSPGSALEVFERAVEGTGMTLKDLHFTVGTGYGRVNVPFAQKTVTEIACHARGAHHVWGGTVRTVLDMGGQDCKAIRCDEAGKVTAFVMNDKCAAGTGRGFEIFAGLVGVPIEELGKMSLEVKEEPPPVSSTCVVFAKTEAAALLRDGWTKEKVLAAYCSAMAQRVHSLLERVGVEKDFVITGGISKNVGIVTRLEKMLGIAALAANPKYDPQLAGALGAALFARDQYEKRRS